MIQPWSTGHDSIFDFGQTTPQLAQISPPLVPKPLAGMDEGQQTHQAEGGSLATNFWDQQLDHPAPFDQSSGMGGTIGLSGEGTYGNGFEGRMEVEFEDMVHHNQCG